MPKYREKDDDGHSNKLCRDRAEAAIEPYDDNPETSVKDLLADLMHYCYHNDFDFKAALESAENHFKEEKGEIPCQKKSS